MCMGIGRWFKSQKWARLRCTNGHYRAGVGSERDEKARVLQGLFCCVCVCFLCPSTQIGEAESDHQHFYLPGNSSSKQSLVSSEKGTVPRKSTAPVFITTCAILLCPSSFLFMPCPPPFSSFCFQHHQAPPSPFKKNRKA